MPNTEKRVILGGRTTPVFLTGCGPDVSEADIVAFESIVGRRLPDDYREFLRCFNGGRSVVSVVYAQGDYERSLSIFLRLRTGGDIDAKGAWLRPPQEINEKYGWNLPPDALAIAADAGGNYFLLMLDDPKCRIRFFDHEDPLELPFEDRHVEAEGFTDLLMRFRTVEEQAEEDREEREAQRKLLKTGPFSERLEAQIRAVEPRYPHIRQWIRKACLAVFEEKGYFSLHADARSRLVFDLVFWLRQAASPATGEDDAIDLAATHLSFRAWWRSQKGGFGLGGYAPGFLDNWWRDRLASGALQIVSNARARMTDAAARALVLQLGSLES